MKNFQYVFLDSGVGGIPYLNYLLSLRPEAQALYVADTKNFPYGEKTQNEVISFTSEIVQKILKNIKPEIIILACNTMTVSAISILRKTFDIPFVGTVPAIKPATLVTKNNRIGLISTERTAKDIYIQRLIDKFAHSSTFFIKGESNLVDKIENGLAYQSEKKQFEVIEPIIQTFEKENCDTLILGCTHFLHLREDFITLGKQFSPEIRVVDSLEGVIKQTLKLSPQENIEKEHVFYVTGVNKNKETEEKYYNYSKYFSLDFIKKI